MGCWCFGYVRIVVVAKHWVSLGLVVCKVSFLLLLFLFLEDWARLEEYIGACM